jgi:hypothetical protein
VTRRAAVRWACGVGIAMCVAPELWRTVRFRGHTSTFQAGSWTIAAPVQYDGPGWLWCDRLTSFVPNSPILSTAEPWRVVAVDASQIPSAVNQLDIRSIVDLTADDYRRLTGRTDQPKATPVLVRGIATDDEPALAPEVIAAGTTIFIRYHCAPGASLRKQPLVLLAERVPDDVRVLVPDVPPWPNQNRVANPAARK